MQGNWGNLIYLGVILGFLMYGLVGNKKIRSKEIIKYGTYWAAIALVLIIAYSYRSEFKGFTHRISGEINPSSARFRENGTITINSSMGNHFFITLLINNKKIRLMVDTGATDLTLSLQDAKKVGINIDALHFNKRYQTANGISYGASIRLDHIQISDLEFNNVRASVNQGEMTNSLLGIGFLKRFQKYEFSGDKLILTP